MFRFAGWKKARCSSVPGWGRECRRCSCSLLNTSQSTRPHTSGSRCHSSGQGSISSRHTHTSRQKPARIAPYFVGTSCKACRTVSPWVCLLKKTHIQWDTKRPDIGGNHCPEDWSSFLVQNWNWGCIYQMNAAEKKMQIIDCQSVPNIPQVFCCLKFSSGFLPHTLCWCSLWKVCLYIKMLDVTTPATPRFTTNPPPHPQGFTPVCPIIAYIRKPRSDVSLSNTSGKSALWKGKTTSNVNDQRHYSLLPWTQNAPNTQKKKTAQRLWARI